MSLNPIWFVMMRSELARVSKPAPPRHSSSLNLNIDNRSRPQHARWRSVCRRPGLRGWLGAKGAGQRCNDRRRPARRCWRDRLNLNNGGGLSRRGGLAQRCFEEGALSGPGRFTAHGGDWAQRRGGAAADRVARVRHRRRSSIGGKLCRPYGESNLKAASAFRHAQIGEPRSNVGIGQFGPASSSHRRP